MKKKALIKKLRRLEQRLIETEKVTRPSVAQEGWKWIPDGITPDGYINWQYVPDKYVNRKSGFGI